MTYKEYFAIVNQRARLISRKRSLEMTIRMNEAWLTNHNSIKGKKRLAKIEAAKKELETLVIPPKPKQPIGYEIINSDGDYVGFYPTDDIEAVKEELLERYGHLNFKIIPKPKWRD